MSISSIRTQIETRMIALDLSRYELAKRAGLSRSRINEYLAGKCDMTGSNLERILEALDWTDIRWKRRRPAKKAAKT